MLAIRTESNSGSTSASPIIDVQDLSLAYGRNVVAEGVNFTIPPGPFGLGLIGESGSGKTSIARAILGLIPVHAGSIAFKGESLTAMNRQTRRDYRRAIQPVFQDGTEVLNPRMSVRAAIREALHVIGRDRSDDAVVALLEDVGLNAELMSRLPHQLSGGQRQRVAIARALAVSPALLILDEPTSALDVSVQAVILDLIERLRAEHKLSYLLITHNLAIVDRLCDEVAVMSGGRVVEQGVTRDILNNPKNDYTAALIAAVPRLRRQG